MTTTHDLEAMFCSYGTIITSRLLLDNNYRPRGVGFVRFNLRQEASMAVDALNGIILEGCNAPLVVKFARNNIKASDMHFAAPPLTPRYNAHQKYVLYVNNLSPEVDENTLMALFSTFGHVQDISIIRNHWDKKKIYAFVTMQNFVSAQNACQQLHGYKVGSKCIYVSFKKNK